MRDEEQVAAAADGEQAENMRDEEQVAASAAGARQAENMHEQVAAAATRARQPLLPENTDGAGAAVEKSIDWHLSPLSPVHCLHRRPGP